jgi:hypothetical protein
VIITDDRNISGVNNREVKGKANNWIKMYKYFKEKIRTGLKEGFLRGFRGY